MNTLLRLALLLTMSFVNIVYAGMPVENLSAEQSSRIVQNVKVQPTDTFDNFLDQLLSSSVLTDQSVAPQSTAEKKVLSLTVKKYRAKETLTASELHMMQRLLGLYSRLKYGQDAINALAKLVAIPTFNVAGLAQHNNPQFKKMASVLAKMAQDFNLEFRNIDNRIYEVSLKGSSKEVVGIHAHADVVPVTPSLWVLEDGTKLDPFHLTRIGDRMYGRGTEDDKNGIVVTMYAMKVIQEENIPLLRNIHLLI